MGEAKQRKLAGQMGPERLKLRVVVKHPKIGTKSYIFDLDKIKPLKASIIQALTGGLKFAEWSDDELKSKEFDVIRLYWPRPANNYSRNQAAAFYRELGKRGMLPDNNKLEYEFAAQSDEAG